MGIRDHVPRARKNRIGDTGRKSEKRVAKSLGAKIRPASGAMPGAKGDMVHDKKWLVEAKSTVHDTMPLDYRWLGKIAHEAMLEGKSPALTVSFVDNAGKAHNFGDWVLVRKKDFEALTEGE